MANTFLRQFSVLLLSLSALSCSFADDRMAKNVDDRSAPQSGAEAVSNASGNAVAEAGYVRFASLSFTASPDGLALAGGVTVNPAAYSISCPTKPSASSNTMPGMTSQEETAVMTKASGQFNKLVSTAIDPTKCTVGATFDYTSFGKTATVTCSAGGMGGMGTLSANQSSCSDNSGYSMTPGTLTPNCVFNASGALVCSVRIVHKFANMIVGAVQGNKSTAVASASSTYTFEVDGNQVNCNPWFDTSPQHGFLIFTPTCPSNDPMAQMNGTGDSCPSDQIATLLNACRSAFPNPTY